MRKLQVTGEGGIDSLRLADAPVPEPGEGKIGVRVTALSLNHRGLTMAKLVPPGTPLPPFTPDVWATGSPRCSSSAW